MGVQVRKWVDKRTAFQCQFDIAFYPARYAKEKFSILPVGDPTQYIPDSEVGCLRVCQCKMHGHAISISTKRLAWPAGDM